MADKDLKKLYGSVFSIAEDSRETKKTISSMHDVICGTDGLIKSIYSFSKSINDMNNNISIISKKIETPKKIKYDKRLNAINGDLNKIIDIIKKKKQENIIVNTSEKKTKYSIDDIYEKLSKESPVKKTKYSIDDIYEKISVIQNGSNISLTLDNTYKKLSDLYDKFNEFRKNDYKKPIDYTNFLKLIYGNTSYINKDISEIFKRLNKIKSKKNKENDVNKITKDLSTLFKREMSSTQKLLKEISKSIKKIKPSAELNSLSSRNNRQIKIDTKNKKDRENKLNGISNAIDVVDKLNRVNLKDLISARFKMKRITNIMENISEKFKNLFKNKKEQDMVLSLIDSSIDIVNKLAKISILKKPAELGAQAIENIMLGKKKNGKLGLIATLEKLSNKKKEIKETKESLKNISKICSSMIVTALSLTSIALVGPTALLGAVVVSGIVSTLDKSIEKLSKRKTEAKNAKGVAKDIIKICSSMITTAISLTGVALVGPTALLGAMVVSGIVSTLDKPIEKLAKRKKEIKETKESLKNISKICSSMIVTALSLTGVALVGPTALLGAVVVDGIASLLGKTFEKLSNSKGKIKKGFASIALMCTGIVAFCASMTLAAKIAKNTTLKEFALTIGVITGTAATIGLVGKMSKSITKGSIAIGIMSVGLLAFSLAFKPFKKSIEGTTLKDVGIMAATIGGIAGVIALAGLVPIQIALGSVALAVASVGISVFSVGLTILRKATNGMKLKDIGIMAAAIGGTAIAVSAVGLLAIPVSIGSLSMLLMGAGITVFSIGLDKLKKSTEGLDKDKIKTMGSSISKIGKSVAAVGLLSVPVAAGSGVLALLGKSLKSFAKSLGEWIKINSNKAVENIKYAITSIKSLISGKNSISLHDAREFKKASKNFMNGMKYTKNGIQSFGDVNGELNSLYDSVSKWNNDIVVNSSNIHTSIKSISDAFDRMDHKSLKNKSNIIKDLFESMGNTRINSETTSLPLTNAINSINVLDISKANAMNDIFKSFSKIRDAKPIDKFTNAVNKFVKSCNDMIDSIERLGDVNATVNTQENQQNTQETYTVRKQETHQNVSTGGVNIENTQQIAEAIAQALRNISVKLNPSMLDINLVAECTTGKTVKLTLQD